jgi:hypothetical protein
MTYVGPLMPCVTVRGVVLAECAFLFADDTDEAHRLATRLGVGTAYWHEERWPHYEVTRAERQRAVRAGARTVNASAVTGWQAARGYLQGIGNGTATYHGDHEATVTAGQQ